MILYMSLLPNMVTRFSLVKRAQMLTTLCEPHCQRSPTVSLQLSAKSYLERKLAVNDFVL